MNLSFNSVSQALNGTNFIFQPNLKYLHFSSRKLSWFLIMLLMNYLL